ncbi:SAVED domain-containing protein [bacterium SCSIO 12741]|nr:SAVED domain-containing protein [bacterium SCSIO 12741]
MIGEITDQEIKEALPDTWKALPWQPVKIEPIKLELGEAKDIHWPTLLVQQNKLFDERVLPVLEDYPNYQICYFGLAPIPLAIHLGTRVQSYRPVEVFQKHHDAKDWRWSEGQLDEPILKEVPEERNKAEGPVTIRFGTRFEIHLEDIEAAVSQSNKDLEIAPPNRGGDVFVSSEHLSKYAGAFRDLLDKIVSNLPRVKDIHLFAAIPVGMSFKLGQEISPTAHPFVHVYEFARDKSPHYQLAFTVNQELNAKLLEIAPKEKEHFKSLRLALREDVESYKNEIVEKHGQQAKHWFKDIAPDNKSNFQSFQAAYWNSLKPIQELNLDFSYLDQNHSSKSEENYYFFTDAFMKALREELPQEDNRRLAIRLFSLGESALRHFHKIQSEKLRYWNLYPKVLEEAVYQSDVYALIHWIFFDRILVDSPAEQLIRSIDVLLSTLWAFDRANGRIQKMEVHRVNRYLIWYYLRERVQADRSINLNQFLDLLAQKPILELRMNAKTDTRNKVVYDFTAQQKDIGLSILHNGIARSFAHEEGFFPLQNLIDGFQNQEANQIKEVIQSLVESKLQ